MMIDDVKTHLKSKIEEARGAPEAHAEHQILAWQGILAWIEEQEAADAEAEAVAEATLRGKARQPGALLDDLSL